MAKQGRAAYGAAWLAAASLWVPFAHFHPGDPDHHHSNGLAHLHLGPAINHPVSEEPEIEPHDDDEAAIWLDWAPTAQLRIVVVAAEASAVLAWGPGYVSVGATPEHRPCSHDPPVVRLHRPRSPPA
ncbi:MAG: hypothetical protein EXQ47_08850 [Bryobacterales bacterium]|nr:hypothetical protein [Bryobacterales bacterium]